MSGRLSDAEYVDQSGVVCCLLSIVSSSDLPILLQGPFTEVESSGFEGLSLNPSAANSRPAFGATCWSSMQPTGVLVTYYVNGTALSTTTQTPIGPSHHVFAHVYDGSRVSFTRKTAPNGEVFTGPVVPSATENVEEELTGIVSIPVITPSQAPNAAGLVRGNGKLAAMSGLLMGAGVLLASL